MNVKMDKENLMENAKTAEISTAKDAEEICLDLASVAKLVSCTKSDA